MTQSSERVIRAGILLLAALALTLAACSGSKDQGPATLTIGFTNDMIGNIRSCGCEVKDYGGIGRRATMIQAVRDTARNFLLLEGGDFLSSEINYSQEKSEVTLKSMSLMGYHGVVLGEKDMSFGLDYIRERCREENLPVLIANLMDAAGDTLIFPPSRSVELDSGLKIGLIGVIDPDLQLPSQVPPGSVRLTNPVPAIRAQINAFGDGVDLIVVLAHMSRSKAIKLARKVTRIDLMVLGHRGRSSRRDERFGSAFLVQAPQNGRYMGYAFSVLDEQNKIATLSSWVEPLDERFEDDPRVVEIFNAYDLSIESQEKTMAELAAARAEEGGKSPYLGAESCRECHADIYDHWQTTVHAHAFDILVSQSREYDRDCTICHSTGFGQPGGFESLAATPDLINVQCESCHGPSAAHAASPAVSTSGDPLSACLDCHTPGRSPGFVFKEKWPLIQH